ncbi:MAG: hypothetical protein JSW65_05385 [Candidatus Bipolaricaulota bacterium]|nr:MAG: hypothetical protein JSW65_05385 [Candidatus Bipolaricaulota bacterium]
MSVFFYVFRDILGSLKPRGALLLFAAGALVFAVLGTFSAFFLLDVPPSTGATSGIEGELIAYFHAQVTTFEVEQIYLDLRDDERVEQIAFVLPQDLTRPDSAGALVVKSSEASSDVLLSELEGSGAFTRVVRTVTHGGNLTALPVPTRTGLLVGLLVGIALCLVVARYGLRTVLATFDGQLRIMQLSGTEEKTVFLPILAVGLGCGLITCLLFIAVLYAFHLAAVANPGATIASANGLLSADRVRLVAVLSGLIGIALGALIGALGVGLAARRSAVVFR